MNALEIRSLRAAYGRIEVLHGVDLDVAPGSVTAVLGANGAGKTTLLSVVAGLHPATAGAVVVAGVDVTNAPADKLARAGLCLIPEGRGVFPNLTVRENLHMVTHCGQPLDEVEASTYERFPRLGERRSQLAGTMSGGERQMLALARGLASDPAVLILDELSMGLAPVIVARLYEHVASIASSGVTIIIVEQFARTALGVSDRAAIMSHGRIRRVGTPDEIEAELSDAYLGGS